MCLGQNAAKRNGSLAPFDISQAGTPFTIFQHFYRNANHFQDCREVTLKAELFYDGKPLYLGKKLVDSLPVSDEIAFTFRAENSRQQEDTSGGSASETLHETNKRLRKEIEDMRDSYKRKRKRMREDMFQLVNRRTNDLLTGQDSWVDIPPENALGLYQGKHILGQGTFSAGTISCACVHSWCSSR